MTLEVSATAQPQTGSDRDHQAFLAARMESVSHFAGGVAHDLNNILTAVLGFGTLLAEQVASDPEAAKSAREVLEAGERAAVLTRQLLALSGRQVLVPQAANLRTVLEGVRARLQDAVGPTVVVDICAHENTPPVFVDVDRLQDSLAALAQNAKAAMPDGGRLKVEVEPVNLDEPCTGEHTDAVAGSCVRITVTDTGSGIPYAVYDRIFEPFFTTRPGGQGMGLGLSVVYGFVKQSGGHIRVDGTPGAGTTFTIDLPRADTPRAVQTGPTVLTPPRATGQTVLVVDDAHAVRALAADYLRRAGYRVIVATSASDALYMAHNHRGPIHLLLTDVIMPGSSGVDLASELRTERRGLRVLFMSGRGDNLLRRNGSGSDGDGFLQKPFSPELLLARTAALIT